MYPDFETFNKVLYAITSIDSTTCQEVMIKNGAATEYARKAHWSPLQLVTEFAGAGDPDRKTNREIYDLAIEKLMDADIQTLLRKPIERVEEIDNG